jgi:DNA-directed RNA polymerase specialized sigma subunit
MTDALETVLQLVASGRLTAEEAAPLIAALQDRGSGPARTASATREEQAERGTARQVRVEVKERGRNVVNVRVPVALGQAAIGYVPGISASDAERIREALELGLIGQILEVTDDEGDGSVRIVLE